MFVTIILNAFSLGKVVAGAKRIFINSTNYKTVAGQEFIEEISLSISLGNTWTSGRFRTTPADLVSRLYDNILCLQIHLWFQMARSYSSKLKIVLSQRSFLYSTILLYMSAG